MDLIIKLGTIVIDITTVTSHKQGNILSIQKSL